MKLTTIFFVVFAVFISGCSSRSHHWSGQRGSCRIAFRTKNISVPKIRLDQTQLGLLTDEIETLPGGRRAEVEFTLNDTECPYYLPGCIDVSYRGNCEVSFQAEAETNYIVEVEGIGKSAFITVKKKSSDDDNAKELTTVVGICHVTERRAGGQRVSIENGGGRKTPHLQEDTLVAGSLPTARLHHRSGVTGVFNTSSHNV